MPVNLDPVPEANVVARVRRNAGPAGVVAGLLIFFGFIWFTGEVGSSAFVKGSLVLRYTLRLGGIAMIGVAIASSVGTLAALLADAVTSLLIGVLIVLSAVLMASADHLGLSQVVIFMCGILFAIAGLRTWGDYRSILRGLADIVDEDEEGPFAESLDDPFRVPTGQPAVGRTSAGRRPANTPASAREGVPNRDQHRTGA